MEHPSLRLVPGPDGRMRGRVRRVAAPTAVVLAAVLASFAERPPHPIAIAPAEGVQDAFQRVLREGAASERLVADSRGLRSHLGRHPLDGEGRAAYATLVSLRAADDDGASVAAHHALAAVRTAPVTVPVVRRAAGVLFRTGRTDEAIGLATSMFGYDPDAAARLLDAFAGVVREDRVLGAIPDAPDAWLAWSSQRRRKGDAGGADRALAEALRRWPDDLGVVSTVAERRVVEDDRAGAIELLRDRSFPRGPETARVRVFRARALAWDGDPAYAREELEAAYEDAPGDFAVLMHGGDVYQAIGDYDLARTSWNRARYRIPRGNLEGRAVFAVRIAKLEDERGDPIRSLRAWERVLEIEPDHPVAAKRLKELEPDPLDDGGARP